MKYAKASWGKVPIMKNFPEIKIFGDECFANEASVNTTGHDKTHVLEPTQTGIAPRSRKETYGYNTYYREPKTHRRIYRFADM